MDKEATKFFDVVLNNSENISSEIRIQFYKLLDLDNKKLSIYENEDARIKEEIQSLIETFNFNLQEKYFLEQIRQIIDDEIKKNQASKNYELTQVSLVERLKKLKNFDVSLEDDFINLSGKIANSFFSRDDIYNYFMSKNEKINNMIKSYNTNIIDLLVLLTPQLIEELSSKEEKNSIQQDEPSVILNNITNGIDNKSNQISKIDGLIYACKSKYNELQRRFSYLNSSATSNINSSKIMFEKEEIRKALKQLKDLIQKLSASKYAEELMSKYSEIQDANILYETVISEIAPSSISASNMTNTVDNIYGNQFSTSFDQYLMSEINFDDIHQKIKNSNNLNELLEIKQQIEKLLGNQYYDTNVMLENELSNVVDKIISLTMRNSVNKTNDPTPNINTQVGGSKDDINTLINSGNYYSVLQGVSSQNVDRYRDFVMIGFNTIMNRWQQQAELCTTLIEQEKSYQDFANMYQNFEQYLPIDESKMLKEYLEQMKNYIEKEKQKNNLQDGIRYNSSEEQINQNSSAMKF